MLSEKLGRGALEEARRHTPRHAAQALADVVRLVLSS